MKTITYKRFIPVLLLLAFAPPSWGGGPPELLSYQGYLVDADGVPLGQPLPANYDVVFSIFSASSGGLLLWTEQQTITVDNGYFSVLLGEGAAVGSDPRPDLSEVFTGFGAEERFVGIAVRFEAGGEFDDILPRLRLLTSPYAFMSSQTRSLVNPDGQSLVSAEGDQVTIAGNLTTTQTMSAAAISGSGIGLTDLNAASVTSGELDSARIPNLSASKITSGTFSSDRLPGTISGTRRFTGDVRVDARILHRTGGVLYSIDRGVGGNAAYFSVSDERLKENIRAIPSPVETLMKLQAVAWDWNEAAIRHFTRNVETNYLSLSGTPEDDRKVWDEKRREIVERYSKQEMGFVAQDLERVFPDWVSTGEGGYKEINMERLSALLVSAIQEQQERIKLLKESHAERLASLEAENADLKRAVEEMEYAQRQREAFAASDRARLEALEERLAALTLSGSDAPATAGLEAYRTGQ